MTVATKFKSVFIKTIYFLKLFMHLFFLSFTFHFMELMESILIPRSFLTLSPWLLLISYFHSYYHICSYDNVFSVLQLLPIVVPPFLLSLYQLYLSSFLTYFHSKSNLSICRFRQTGKADLEVMFLSERPDEDFYHLIYYTVNAYHDTFTQLCKGYVRLRLILYIIQGSIFLSQSSFRCTRS